MSQTATDCQHRDVTPDDTGNYQCDDCATQIPTCSVGAHPSRQHGITCDKCTVQTLTWLNDVVDLYATLPDHIGVIAGLAPGGKNRSNDTSMPGGDALVMLSPGSEGRAEQHRITAFDGDAPSVAHALSAWEDEWRTTRGEQAAPELETTTGAAKYLARHNAWAAQCHGGYGEYRDELRRLRGRLRSVCGDSARPVRAAVACLDCGGDLVRPFTEVGLSDVWECEDCGRHLTAGQYVQAVKAKLQDAPPAQAPTRPQRVESDSVMPRAFGTSREGVA